MDRALINKKASDSWRLRPPDPGQCTPFRTF